MIKHFFRVVLRVIIRNRMVTTLNIAGLAAGLVCFILIYLLITDELKYDRFHVKSSQLYRIYEKQAGGDGTIFETPMTPAPLASYLKEKYEDIVASTRVVGFWQDVLVEGGDKRFSKAMACMWIHPS